MGQIAHILRLGLYGPQPKAPKKKAPGKHAAMQHANRWICLK